ncbi:Hypothetical predicted protein [Lecanosticta acicola]|uniref:Vacuolar protein sorting-associated protein 62 n=1 Tax=Lecanosticta acicola TaxID=111012 RepID=A0AAI8W2F1_9PEZI|nr:Hypothetical predicted protein [Lecanosticta acicola]
MLSFLLFAGLAAAAAAAEVPGYVNKYAPMVYLYSGENYLPADIGAQLENTHPDLNFTKLDVAAPTLENLDDLNSTQNSNGGQDVYLTSNSDPTTNPRPQYLSGVRPDANGKTENAVSSVIITTAHPENQTLDAFYFYFYAFDYGGDYPSIGDPFIGNIGNHVGDWEHNMIRFNSTTGLPLQVWYSQHASGQAFTYAATEKYGKEALRPVTYCANGSHANYAKSGTHDHTIPGVTLPYGPIEDHTDNGTLWDPTQNAYYFSFTPSSSPSNTSDDTGTFTAYNSTNTTTTAPANFLSFTGHWGDEMPPESDARQKCFLDIAALCAYTSGPTGPYFKDLNRARVCPDSDEECLVYTILLPRRERLHFRFQA